MNSSANDPGKTPHEADAVKPKKRFVPTVRDITVFAMLGAVMFCSKILMEWAPNIHFLALFLLAFTRVYRARALFPLYIFVFLTGLFGGFGIWWIPYLYIWLPLFGVGMAIPPNLKKKFSVPAYMAAGALHGLLYGTLYAPAQALLMGMNFKAMLAWIIAGFPFDITHALGNLAACTLVLPLSDLLFRIERLSQK